MRFIRFLLIGLLVAFFIFILFQSKWHRTRSQIKLPDEVKSELVNLAATSLLNNDVPVGAILMYKGNILGKGFNTVLRDSSISGHAEINALNSGLKTYGYNNFMKLDRSQLTLYSTFEPCEMCKGTLEHYNIRNSIYLKEKSLSHWLKKDLKSVYYNLIKQKATGGNIQDSLFMLHPNYPLK